MYVAYFAPTSNSPSLVIKAVDGETVRIVPTPKGAYLPSPYAESGISPHGKYFVYYTGSPRWLEELNHKFDLTLHVASIVDGEDRASIRLVRDTFVDDVQQEARALASNPPEELDGDSSSEIAAGLFDAFLVGITSVAWSPDGRYLAFAGAIDGPSSDIYLYDTENGSVRRLTSGPDEILKIAWSPDGRWIMHGSAKVWEMGSSLTNHAVRFDGAQVVSFPFGGAFDRGWLTDHKYLVTEGANGIGSYDLAVLDIDEGQRISVWPWDFGGLAWDATGSTLLLSSFGIAAGSPGPGLYKIDMSHADRTKLADDPFQSIEYWPAGRYEFVATGFEHGLFGITSEGNLQEIADGTWILSVSPDLTSLALFGSAEKEGLYIMDDPNTSLRMLDNRDAYGGKWAPDSNWVMYRAGSFQEDSTITVTKANFAEPMSLQVLPIRMCQYPEPVWIVAR